MNGASDKQPVDPEPELTKISIQLGLADVMQAQSRYAEAESLARAALTGLSEVGEIESQAAMTATNILGQTRLACGSPRDAIELFGRSVALGARLGPSVGLLVGEAWFGLCEAHDENGDFEALAAAVDRARAVVAELGPDHRLRVDVTYWEAILAATSGRLAETERALERALAIAKQGSTHDDAMELKVRHTLGAVYRAQQRYGDAEAILESLLPEVGKRLGSRHERYALTLQGLARVRRMQGRLSEAEAMLYEALEGIQRSRGREAVATAAVLNDLGLVVSDLGRSDEARAYFVQALEIAQRLLPWAHSVVGHYVNNLASLFCDRGLYSDAEPLHRRALEIHKAIHGTRSPQVALALNNVAHCVAWQGRFLEANALYEDALETVNSSAEVNLDILALVLSNLGDLKAAEGDVTAAERHYRRAIEVRNSFQGPDVPDLVWPLRRLADLRVIRHDLDDAERCLQRAMAICKTAKQRYDGILDDLAALYGRRGMRSQAEAFAAQAQAQRTALPTRQSN